LITRTVLGEEYRAVNSSLRSFHHFNITFSLLSPNNLLNSLFSNTLNHVPPQCERSYFTPIQNNRQNYKSLYLNLYIFR
jgi:hypothetical protein